MNEPDVARLAARVDRLASIFLARSAPLRVEVAHLDAERDALFRLRYQIAIERGWVRPEDMADGRERDAYDADAVQIGAWIETELAGTARIVPPSADRALPVEAAFGLVVEPAGRVAELSRVTVVRAFSGSEHRVFLGLLAKAWLEGRTGGFDTWAGAETPAVIRLYRHLGLVMKPLGSGIEYDGVVRVPVLYDIPASATSLEAHVRRLLSSTNRQDD